MKYKNKFIFSYYLILIFAFIYTLPINLKINTFINTLNMLILFIIFLIWLYSWYLFFVKDILKSNQQERNGISLVLVLLAVVIFYYNPFPKPENYNVTINTLYIFIFTLIAVISFLKVLYKQDFFTSALLILIPITIHSFFVNILNYNFNKMPYITLAIIIISQIFYFSIKKLKK